MGDTMADSVLVTGASGGLGRAVTARFLADGWRVVAADRGWPTRPRRASSHWPTDVTDADEVARAVAVAAGDPQAPLRAVLNLVGGYAEGGRVHETPVEDFEAQLRLNLRPTYVVTAAALPHLVAAGGGSVVCVSSRAAAAALRRRGRLHHREGGRARLRGRAGGRVPRRRRTGQRRPAERHRHPGQPGRPADADHGRWVAPEQIADVIAVLCSDAVAVTSGAHIPVYGRA